MPNLGVIFLTGLVTGGVTCAAVQGGLLVSLIASKGLENVESKFETILQFLGSKLFAYLLLGMGLGWLGSKLVISPSAYGVAQIVAGIYMLGVAGALVDLHPVFRYFLLQPPKWARDRIRHESKSKSKLAAILLGLATVLIPCGTTQAVMAQAITTANPVWGALVMAVFVVGTMPLFILLGLGVAKAGNIMKGRLIWVAAAIIVFVAISSINGGLILAGSPLYPSKIAKIAYCAISFCPKNVLEPTRQVAIDINKYGYAVDNPNIKAGEEITLKISNSNGTGCQQAFTIPALNVSQIVPVGQSSMVTFKAPEKRGTLAFSCSMGMFEGEFNVI